MWVESLRLKRFCYCANSKSTNTLIRLWYINCVTTNCMVDQDFGIIIVKVCSFFHLTAHWFSLQNKNIPHINFQVSCIKFALFCSRSGTTKLRMSTTDTFTTTCNYDTINIDKLQVSPWQQIARSVYHHRHAICAKGCSCISLVTLYTCDA